MDWCDVIDSFNRIEGGDVMVQRVVKHDTTFTPCACGRQPQHIETMSMPSVHWFECNPCSVRTGRCRSELVAIETWETRRAIQQSVAA